MKFNLPIEQLTAVEAVRRAQPLWCDLTLSVDFEKESLPLLFASDEDYNSYYAAMEALHYRKLRVIRQIRAANDEARAQRAACQWADCIESLKRAIDLRHTVFAARDYQCVAAQVHLAWSAIHAATILSVVDDEESLAQAHSLFGAARRLVHALFADEAANDAPRTVAVDSATEAILAVARAWVRRRMLAVLNTNWANYWAARNRWGACVQHAETAAACLNVLFPIPPCAIAEPVIVTVGDADAPTLITVPPPPAALFPPNRDVSSNPHPLVAMADARMASSSARMAVAGTASLTRAAGLALSKERLTAMSVQETAGPALSSTYPLPAPNFDAIVNDGSNSNNVSRRSDDGDKAPLGGAWRLLASQASEFVVTLLTPRAAYAACTTDLSRLATILNLVTAGFIAVHVRDFNNAFGYVRQALSLVMEGPATTPEGNPPTEQTSVAGNPSDDAAPPAAAVPAVAPPVLSPSEWGKKLELLLSLTRTAESTTATTKYTMPLHATRMHAALAASLLMRQDLIASRERKTRLQREVEWMKHSVANDESGTLEDETLDPQFKRSLFKLPASKAEDATLDKHAARAATPNIATSSRRPGDGGDESPTQDNSGSGVGEFELPRMPKRAHTPGVKSTSGKPLIALRDIATASVRYREEKRRAATPLQPTVDAAATRPAPALLDVASGASPLPPSDAAAAPSNDNPTTSVPPINDEEATRVLEMKKRQTVLRAMLPTIDPHAKAYRDLIRELAANEASLREAREAAARAKLLADAQSIAKRGSMTAAWAKCEQSLQQQQQQAGNSDAAAPKRQPSKKAAVKA